MAFLAHPYVLALVLPALLVNLVAAVALGRQDHPKGQQLLAEVEILAAECQPTSHEHRYRVRITRLVKGRPDVSELSVRFPDDVPPERVARAHTKGVAFANGSRLFVVLRQNGNCDYVVRHYWLGSAPFTRAAVDHELLSALG